MQIAPPSSTFQHGRRQNSGRDFKRERANNLAGAGDVLSQRRTVCSRMFDKRWNKESDTLELADNVATPENRAWAFPDKFYGSLDFGGERKPKSRDLALIVLRRLTKFLSSIGMKFYFDHFKA